MYERCLQVGRKDILSLLDRAGSSLRSLIFPGDHVGEEVVSEVFDKILVLQPRQLRYLRWHERDEAKLWGVWYPLCSEPLPIRGGWSLRFLLALRFLDNQAIEGAAIWDSGFELDVECAFCARRRVRGEPVFSDDAHRREPGLPSTVLRCNRCGDIYCQSCRHCWPARVEPTRELAIKFDDWQTTDRCSCFQGIQHTRRSPSIRHCQYNCRECEEPSITPATPAFCMPRSRHPVMIWHMKVLGGCKPSFPFKRFS